jgi:hypothetical protein
MMFMTAMFGSPGKAAKVALGKSHQPRNRPALDFIVVESGIIRLARRRDVAGIDAIGLRAILLDRHDLDESRVCRRAVIAFDEIVDDVLPVGLQVVSQPVRELQVRQLRLVAQHLRLKIAGLALQARRIRIQIDIDEAGHHLDAHFLQMEIVGIELRHMFRAPRGAQPPVGMERPGMIGAGDDP